MKIEGQYRAASWWLTWEDMSWPNGDLEDKFKRRADKAAESGVNMAIIYGAHFRWDFMPLWLNLHDMIRFAADELHKRGILLFDHHSAVLTHRYTDIEGAKAMRLRNRHHLSFAPSSDVAAEWRYKGKLLNDWRMIDISTGKHVVLPSYNAEEFCMNNPDFQWAYQDYVKRLVADTGIDGLECDDGIFYSNWTGCGCQHCRAKFKKQYGHELPGTGEKSFWGNYKNEAFKDWIEMRYASAREFLEGVRGVLGKGFPLMACCSNSEAWYLPSYGMTYQDFIKPCDHIMLEMCGDTPSVDGTWSKNVSSQLLHLAISAENNAPCLGLGYGFAEPTANFIWAFNKFLGSGTWFSSLKGRLGLLDSQLKALPKDDVELPAKGFNAEKLNPEIFNAKSDAQAAVYFSRWSRDYYSRSQVDYVADFQATCKELFEKNITVDAATVVPASPGKYKVLCLSSASALADGERAALDKYLSEGGTIVASGPCGLFDKRGNLAATPWLAQFGLSCKIDEPERAAGFPPNAVPIEKAPLCHGFSNGEELAKTAWVEIKHGKGTLLWTPGRMQTDAKELGFASRVEAHLDKLFVFPPQGVGWRFRVFKDGDRRIVHALASNYDVKLMEDLEKLRTNRGNTLIKEFSRKDIVSGELSIGVDAAFTEAEFFAPLNGKRKKVKVSKGKLAVKLDEKVYYFILSFKA